MVEHSVEDANQPAQGVSLGLSTNKIPTYKKHITEETIAAAVAFAVSLFFGVLLLNLLPGCVQRLPADDDTFKLDIYSMYTIEGGREVGFWSNGLRRCFVAGIFLLALFIVCRFATYAFPNLHASMRWLF